MKILSNGVAVIEGDTHHAVWCETEGLVHDLFTANILRRLIREHGVRTCVDGGANIGTLTRVMLDAGCRVYAYEPNPAAVECLRHNCPEAEIEALALSDAPGVARLIRLDNAGASFVESGKDGIGLQVKLEPLDLQGLRPGLIKLDIEGHECAALLGAEHTIRACKPVLAVEVNEGALRRAGYDKEALAGILRGFGYRWQVMQPDCDWNSPQFDIIALPGL